MKAESAETFFRAQKNAISWENFAALKTEIDSLIGRDLNAAAKLSLRIIELAELTNDRLAKAFAEAARARVLHQQSRPSEAIKFYDRAIQVLLGANLKIEAAVLQKSQVDAFKRLGRFAEALDAAEMARRALRRAGRVQLAQLETNVGNVYYQQDQYKKALAHYNRARTIFAESGESAMQALVDVNRADIFIELDQPDKALELFENSAKIFDAEKFSLNATEARFHIAYLSFLRGKYNQALTSYYKARERAGKLGYRRMLAWCDLEIAEMLLALNAFDDAFESATNAGAQFEKLELGYEVAKSLLTRALAAAGLERFDEAKSDLLKARKMFAQKKNAVFTAVADQYLGEIAIHQKRWKEAERRLNAALQIFVNQKLPTKTAYARLLAANLAYQQTDLSKAKRLANAALKDVETIFAPTMVYRAQHLLGKIERSRKRPALDYFRKAVGVIENLRIGIAAAELKTTFLRDKIAVYEDAIQTCLDEGSDRSLEEAFRLVESSKSRALADLISRYLSDADMVRQTGEQSPTRKRLSKLIEELNWYASQAGLEEDKGEQRRVDVAARYRAEVERREKQIARLFRRLEAENPSSAQVRNDDSTTLEDLRSTLEADETAIEYFITGDEISAFVATSERSAIIRQIASKNRVEKILTALRFQIEKFNYGAAYVDAYFGPLKRTTDEHLTELYQSVFAPVEQYLTGNKLVIIPHGALHYLPFHALREGANYLIDRFEISYAPSASVLKLCRNRHQQLIREANSQSGERDIQFTKRETSGHTTNNFNRPTLLAVGVAESGTPSIEEEIATLSSIFPDALKLTGKRATHGNLLQIAPQARFLHLASHGYFRRDNPMFSFLKLADTNLNFYNLLNLRLQAEMVTLSACHTGVNGIFPGDELHGLMRGFLYAGAPSMVVSLWAVNDRSTADFMREMYTHIKSGKTRRAAIRHAQLAIKDAYGHPYYWAPFILMGDTASVNLG
ncbi:MAG: CHAT domain-containing protein [Acidobacteriota bacterium]